MITADDILSGRKRLVLPEPGPRIRVPRGSPQEWTDHDRARFDVEGADDEPSIAPVVVRGGPDHQADLYGRTFDLPLAFSTAGDPFAAVSVPRSSGDRSWVVTIQVGKQATGGALAGDSPYVVATVNYGQGQARFSRSILLPPSPIPIKFQLFARSIDISVYYSLIPATKATISIAAVPGEYSGADAFSWSWSATPKTGAGSFGTVFTGPGVVGQIHAMLTAVAVANTPLWLLGFDEIGAGAPTGGSVLVPGCRLAAMFNAGDDRSISMKDGPGSMFFVNGLKLALSTSPDAYAAAAGGNNVTIDAEVGQ